VKDRLIIISCCCIVVIKYNQLDTFLLMHITTSVSPKLIGWTVYTPVDFLCIDFYTYSSHWESATSSRIQMIEPRSFVLKFLPLYHYGGQFFGGFNDGNAQEWTNFGNPPEALSQWLEYRLNHTAEDIFIIETTLPVSISSYIMSKWL